MANAAVASDRAVVQYMLAEQFTAGGTAWSEAVGESQLHAFLTSKNAALLNTVTLTGLEAGKAYVYRVGDGSDEHWSATGTFRTRGKSL
ncbi:MAG: fibronectin type III domain-containing protein [Oscillospiraceae bacterium]|nr:MAG: fibronectin type III domain-containing protein [Oscillospiraceae bacterium]